MSCIFLSLSIKRHYVSAIVQSKIPHRIGTMLFRLCGVLCLILSFILLFDLHGLALGLVYLAATFTVASLIQTLLLSYLNNWINKISLALVLMMTVLTLHEESTPLQMLVAYFG
jgi:inner membrane protein involved in colicin E2 resistance